MSGNQAHYQGGGVAATNSLSSILNCTVSGNSAGDEGGGVWAGWDATTVKVSHSTIFGNDSIYGGRGIHDEGYHSLIRNCILADNSGGDAGGELVFDDYNLIETMASGAVYTGTTTHHITGVDPMLGPLTYNGGTTKTMALKFGSPAKDAGICTDTDDNPVTTDQRGIARPQGSACDIGAYELKSGSGTGPMELLLLHN